MESKNIFDRINEKAKEKGISINSLEDQAGVSTGSIYKWNIVSPTIKNLKRVAEVLECGVDDLVKEEKEDLEPQKKRYRKRKRIFEKIKRR